MKNIKEQKRLQIRVSCSEEKLLSRSETKKRLTDLFALLLEMEIDQQNDVQKEYPYAKQAK